jgi:hypothetical protein
MWLYRVRWPSWLTALHEPYDAFWGARYAIVEDAGGNAVGIMSPVDPARRSDAGFP